MQVILHPLLMNLSTRKTVQDPFTTTWRLDCASRLVECKMEIKIPSFMSSFPLGCLDTLWPSQLHVLTTGLCNVIICLERLLKS